MPIADRRLHVDMYGAGSAVVLVYREMLAGGRAGAFDPRASWLDRMASPGVGTGAQDNAVPAAWSEEIARSAPDGGSHRVSGAGQAVLIERPEEVIQMVERFLDEPTREEP
jgi:hypothetical protein